MSFSCPINPHRSVHNGMNTPTPSASPENDPAREARRRILREERRERAAHEREVRTSPAAVADLAAYKRRLSELRSIARHGHAAPRLGTRDD